MAVVLENVPGLVRSTANRECFERIIRAMAGTPVVWRTQLLCPHKHWGGCVERLRWVAVGVRADLAAEGARS